MTDHQDFQPDWISPPGDTILDLLAKRAIATDLLAKALHSTRDELQELLDGRRTITIEYARTLSSLLGGTVDYWVARDFQYREDASRRLAEGREWLSGIPLGELIRLGWLAPPKPTEELEACLEYFGVSTVAEWKETHRQLLQTVAFRTSASFDSRPGAVAAWMRRAETITAQRECADWDPAAFAQKLITLRHLTIDKDPLRFVPSLVNDCASCGVSLVVLRAPVGCRASGATRFVSDRRAMLVLSGRHMSDDQFWFTFFHESAHLLLHDRSRAFIEGIDTDVSAEEREANKFASDILVAEKAQPYLLRLRTNVREIVRFAVQHKLPPGIVVGQLQHYGRLQPNRLNSLKRMYSWEGDRLILKQRT